MKYLKKWRLFENHDDIHDTCKKYGIISYTINPDGSIDIEGNVYLSNKGLTKLPLNFNRISGSFNCNDNQLMSLSGAPQRVGGDFSCNNNQLTSLEGSPKEVGGGFYCYNNQLINLRGSPISVDGNFSCNNNKLISFEGTQNTMDIFNCSNNNLTSLKGLEFKSFYWIDLQNNPIYPIVEKWINNYNREELIEYFVDMNIIQDNKLIMMRLEAFYEDMGLKMDINFNKVKKYYEIIR